MATGTALSEREEATIIANAVALIPLALDANVIKVDGELSAFDFD